MARDGGSTSLSEGAQGPRSQQGRRRARAGEFRADAGVARRQAAGVDRRPDLAYSGLEPGLATGIHRIIDGIDPLDVRAETGLAGQIQSPDYLAGRALKVALFPKQDPTLRQATPKSISGLNHKDVKNYYEKAFRPDLTTLVVVGKVTRIRMEPLGTS